MPNPLESLKYPELRDYPLADVPEQAWLQQRAREIHENPEADITIQELKETLVYCHIHHGWVQEACRHAKVAVNFYESRPNDVALEKVGSTRIGVEARYIDLQRELINLGQKVERFAAKFEQQGESVTEVVTQLNGYLQADGWAIYNVREHWRHHPVDLAKVHSQYMALLQNMTQKPQHEMDPKSQGVGAATMRQYGTARADAGREAEQQRGLLRPDPLWPPRHVYNLPLQRPTAAATLDGPVTTVHTSVRPGNRKTRRLP